jgi:hypothetical protein
LLIPYKAHGAATLMSLGADEIVMGEMAQLTPIEPTTVNPMDSIDVANLTGRWPISLVDITAYLSLATEKAELVKEESREKYFILSQIKFTQ